MRSELITPPSIEPVSLEEAKLHLRVDIDADDDLITSLIKTARQMAENHVSVRFLEQTWDTYLDTFPSGRGVIRLPRVPVASISSISYSDADGETQTLAADDYQLSGGVPARLAPAAGTSWPATECYLLDAVAIRYVCGVEAVEDLTNAETIQAAMKLTIGSLYENREGVITGTIATELPDLARRLLDSVEWGAYW